MAAEASRLTYRGTLLMDSSTLSVPPAWPGARPVTDQPAVGVNASINPRLRGWGGEGLPVHPIGAAALSVPPPRVSTERWHAVTQSAGSQTRNVAYAPSALMLHFLSNAVSWGATAVGGRHA
jgi:hypothetical protein